MALAATVLASYVATAMPYATSLTNSGGVVSFRLNQTTATNDTVYLLSAPSFSVTNYLQRPRGDTDGIIQRGLVTTNLTITSPFKVVIKHIGSGVVRTNSPKIALSSPRGVSVNQNTNSPYFGWVYASRAGQGIFVYGSDLSDITGQGATAKNGGYPFSTSSTSWTPYRISVAPDDTLLVCDDSDKTGNLLSYDPLCNTYQYVLQPIASPTAPGNGSCPVGSNNVHGSVSSAVMVGTGANRILYTVDEDYQTDPTSATACEWNSTWRYSIGASNGISTLTYSNYPDAKLMTPWLYNYNGQNEEVVYGNANGYLYFFQRRANPLQYGAYIVNPNAIVDPATYPCTWGGYIWDSQTASLAEGWPDDLMRDLNGVAVSPDGKWLAFIYYEDLVTQVNSITGETWAPRGNDIVILPLTNGIPEFNKRIRVTGQLGVVAAGRGIAFDAADNLYAVSSGMALLQSFDLGQSGTATTGSDGTFSLDSPATTVSVETTTPVAYEQGTVPGVFKLTRQTGVLIPPPLTVAYTLSGTAANGTDYTNMSGTVTFPNGAFTVNLYIKPIDDSIPELTESVTLTIAGDPTGTNYNTGIPGDATLYIVDNETPELRIRSASKRMYEVNEYDFTRLRIERWGDTNTALTLDAPQFTFTGSAVQNTDFYVTNLPTTIAAGTVSQTIELLGPINNSLLDGTRTINLTMLAGTGYTVVSNTATVNIIDDEVPAETVLWSDNFHTDTSANYTVAAACTNGETADYEIAWAYEYNTPWLIPAAPLSGGNIYGARLRVNKFGGGTAAGLNVYPTGQSFSGNYALRFDMYLMMGGGSYTTEYAIFGINHSGTKTNWFRNTTLAPGNVPAGWQFDGIWCDVEADGSASGDYVMYSGPAVTLASGGVAPTALPAGPGPGDWATSFLSTFQSPPWWTGGSGGGMPANLTDTTKPSWAQVELSQVNGVITLTINKTKIFDYTNTTAYTSGNIMLGYCDGYDSIGPADAGVIYANARVVALPPTITSIVPTGGNNYDINYAGGNSATVVLLASPTVNAPLAGWTRLATSPNHSGTFHVVGGAQTQGFYRLKAE